MTKKKLCIMLIFSFLLTGCSSVKLSQTESGQVSEYIAYSLLKFNGSPDMLITDTVEETADIDNSAEPSASTTEIQTNIDNTVNTTESPVASESTTTTKNVVAGDLFGSSDFQVSITNSGMYDSYPDDGSNSYFSLSATSGKKLLVLQFKVKNTGSATQTFKTSGTGLSYTLNGDSSQKALVTLLEEDVHFFKTSIKSGKSLKALLVFEVNEDTNLDNLNVTISKSGQVISVPVQ